MSIEKIEKPTGKINQRELSEAIKAIHPEATISIEADEYKIIPDKNGNYGEGLLIPGRLVIELPEGKEIKTQEILDVVSAHAPAKTDKEEEKMLEAIRLFDLLSLDPRFFKLSEKGL